MVHNASMQNVVFFTLFIKLGLLFYLTFEGSTCNSCGGYSCCRLCGDVPCSHCPVWRGAFRVLGS